jgi:hypothetical protein
VTPELTRAANTSPRTAASTVNTEGDQHHLLLLFYGHAGVPAQQRQHVRPKAVQLLVELVAELVDAVDFLVQRLLVAGIERRQQAPGFRIDVAAGIVVDGFDPALELAKRRQFADRRPLRDQPPDQGTRGQDFQFNLCAQGLVAVAQRRLPAAVFRRLQLIDDDPAYRQPPLQRADIGARQIPIGRHVAVGELLDPTADLHHQHDGPYRGNHHQCDQRHRDPHDLVSN